MNFTQHASQGAPTSPSAPCLAGSTGRSSASASSTPRLRPPAVRPILFIRSILSEKRPALLRIPAVIPSALVLTLLVALTACKKSASPASGSPVAHYTYSVVNSWPHDPAAFTQGLVYHDGALLESTGLNGRSSVRKVDLASGRVLKRVNLPDKFFGEGLTLLGDRLYQLTWQNQKGFIYDVATLSPIREFAYTGEGWGLTTDGASLILSDGTDRIRFLDPETFRVVRTLSVTREGRPFSQLNELEFIDGEIVANVWKENTIVRIDPSTGRITAVIDLTGILPAADRTRDTDVLNGIAYDPATKRLFVTGKNWPRLFEIKLLPKSP